jgi:hypothetical protein
MATAHHLEELDWWYEREKAEGMVARCVGATIEMTRTAI